VLVNIFFKIHFNYPHFDEPAGSRTYKQSGGYHKQSKTYYVQHSYRIDNYSRKLLLFLILSVCK